MDAPVDLVVKHVKSHGASFVCINVYSPDSLMLNTTLWLTRLYGFEVDFTGGRFQRFSKEPCENKVVISRTLDQVGEMTKMNRQDWFGKCLEWLGETVETRWHLDVKAIIEHEDFAPLLHFNFSFDDIDDAVLFKLTFS